MVFIVPPASCLVTSLNSEFITFPFSGWKNVTGTCRGALNWHSLSHSHLQCYEQPVTFIAVMERKRPCIKSHLSEAYKEQVHQNEKALISIIQYLIKQGLALRGHTWNKCTKTEGGNFTKLIDLVAKYNVELKSHLLLSARNA